jgi:Flp pilus assembly pilin Flp
MDRAGGQTLGEYVLILMMIVIVAVVVVTWFGDRVSNFFMQVVRAF